MSHIPLPLSQEMLYLLQNRTYLRGRSFTNAVAEIIKAGYARKTPGRYPKMVRTAKPWILNTSGAVEEKDLWEPTRSAVERATQKSGEYDGAAICLVSAKWTDVGLGPWSVPDVVTVAVPQLIYYRPREVEVAAYEVKKAGDTNLISAVHESLAHSRWSHYCTVVIHILDIQEPSLFPESLFEECRRHGIGLATIRAKKSAPGADDWEMETLIESDRHNPRPASVDSFLTYILSERKADENHHSHVSAEARAAFIMAIERTVMPDSRPKAKPQKKSPASRKAL